MNAPTTIPLFPLGTVLFPDGTLPLQIFEVRYLDMVRRCQQEGRPFGVVCLTAGHEVQQRDPNQGEGFQAETFESVGTLAHITQLESPRPGLLLIACRGGERFRIERSEKLKHGLWMADITTLPPDAPVVIPEELTGIPRALRHLHERLTVEHPGDFAPLPGSGLDTPPWNDAGWVANRWAELLPLPPFFKQRLLALDSPLLRLELVGDALDQLGVSH